MEPTANERKVFRFGWPYKAALAALVIAGGSLAAHLYVQSQIYYPIVRVEIPGAITVAAVMAKTKDREACAKANDRFLTPFKTQCRNCTITVSRCARELDGFELTLRDGGPLPYPVVVNRGTRVAFMGPGEVAYRQCQEAAAYMHANGAKSATCVAAQAAPNQR